MKLLNALVGTVLIANSAEAQKGPKTPYRRRLQKTFDLIDLWGEANLASHPNFVQKREDKDNQQTKFAHKLKRITDNIVNLYEERIAQIAKECPELDTCQAYLDCSGEGDRMNTVRGRPDVELSDSYIQFVKDKWGRSKARVFDVPECGFKTKKVENLSEKFVGMLDSFVGWRLQCRKFPGAACPAHCTQEDKKGETVCTPKE